MARSRESSLIALAAVSGAVVGGLVGAVAGILLAPDSGEVTRAKLKKKGKKFYDESQKEWEKFQKETLEPNVKKFRKEFDKKFSETKDSIVKKMDTKKSSSKS